MTQPNSAVTTKSKPPRFIFHVGNGLGHYVDETDLTTTKVALHQMMAKAVADLTKSDRNFSMAFPDALMSPSRAVMEIMKAFRGVVSNPHGVLSVTTFSEGVVGALLSALYDIGFSDSVLVCFHQDPEKEGYSTHTLDADGCIENWSYGVLSPYINSDYLSHLDFKSVVK